MMKIEVFVIPYTDLRPYELNARVHTYEQIEQIVSSIRAFGWTTPIHADKSHG